jgi:hypothetical protein
MTQNADPASDPPAPDPPAPDPAPGPAVNPQILPPAETTNIETTNTSVGANNTDPKSPPRRKSQVEIVSSPELLEYEENRNDAHSDDQCHGDATDQEPSSQRELELSTRIPKILTDMIQNGNSNHPSDAFKEPPLVYQSQCISVYSELHKLETNFESYMILLTFGTFR